jgi:hypothetical protein
MVMYLVSFSVTFGVGVQDRQNANKTDIYQIYVTRDGSSQVINTLDTMYILGFTNLIVMLIYASLCTMAGMEDRPSLSKIVSGEGYTMNEKFLKEDKETKENMTEKEVSDLAMQNTALDLTFGLAQLILLPLIAVVLFYQFGVQTQFACLAVAIVVTLWIFASFLPIAWIDLVYYLVGHKTASKAKYNKTPDEYGSSFLVSVLSGHSGLPRIVSIMALFMPVLAFSFLMTIFSLAWINSGQAIDPAHTPFYQGTTGLWVLALLYFLVDMLLVVFGAMFPLFTGMLLSSKFSKDDWVSHAFIRTRHLMLAVFTFVFSIYMAVALRDFKQYGTRAPTPFA